MNKLNLFKEIKEDVGSMIKEQYTMKIDKEVFKRRTMFLKVFKIIF